MSFSAWLNQLDFSYVLDLGISALAALLCICFHESAHGLCALWMGDRTAKNAGRITLNPLRHVDLVGLILLAVAHVGWAKPVPIDARNFRRPKLGMVLTALAGPVSNFLLALPAAFFFLLFSCLEWGYPMLFFYYLTIITCGLGVFNLIPIPPLDGSKVLFGLLPKKYYWLLMRYEKYGMILLVILVALGTFSGILSTGVDAVANLAVRLMDPLVALFF